MPTLILISIMAPDLDSKPPTTNEIIVKSIRMGQFFKRFYFQNQTWKVKIHIDIGINPVLKLIGTEINTFQSICKVHNIAINDKWKWLRSCTIKGNGSLPMTSVFKFPDKGHHTQAPF